MEQIKNHPNGWFLWYDAAVKPDYFLKKAPNPFSFSVFYSFQALIVDSMLQYHAAIVYDIILLDLNSKSCYIFKSFCKDRIHINQQLKPRGTPCHRKEYLKLLLPIQS